MSAGASAGAAAAAAEAKRRRDHEEEEEATPMNSEADTEYKIIRSVTGSFKKPEEMKRILAEEAEAGWTLVEKFDDNRIRLKRPVSARGRDHLLSRDPYRIKVGMSEGMLALAIVGAVFLVMLTVILLVTLLPRH